MYTQKLKSAFALLLLILILLTGGLLYLLYASLPATNGQLKLVGLTAPVTVNADKFNIPSILAKNRQDAFQVLGYLHARDRLFQMDLMRRKSAGRLAEIFGAKAVNLDRSQRDYRFAQTAANIISALPAQQKSVLEAYVKGVNAFISETKPLPPEFIALNYRPEPWEPEDSILVALSMFQTLNGQEQDERMVTVMERALPPALLQFLTPDSDIYTKELMGGPASHRHLQSIPISEFNQLDGQSIAFTDSIVDTDGVIAGSNNWVVAGSKTRDGRAIIANDMHLGLNAPNIWFRAELSYAEHYLNGVTLPGVPLLIIGSNRHVAWGFTNATADLLDLISLDINPNNPDEYLTPQGWRSFTKTKDQIKIKNGADIQIELRSTLWGPVSSQTLLGKPVAIKWTALESSAIDLGLLDMDSVTSTATAMTVLNRAGGPPQNVVLADRDGHIGWTYMGRFPKRRGFDGLSSKSWANPEIAWDGFIPAGELPRLYDPPSGFIATANSRTLGREYPYVLGYNWALAYRSYRITQLLNEADRLTEADMLQIQLDTRSEILEFYRQLALGTLSRAGNRTDLEQIGHALRAWDGYMHNDSKGAALLTAFRAKLAESVFAKVVAHCRQFDPDFKYAWREMETPLRELLIQMPKGVLPVQFRDDWDLLILDALVTVTTELSLQFPNITPANLQWGTVNTIKQQHPFSKNLTFLEAFLDIASFESDGCASLCIKVMSNTHGASERLVLSPAHPEDGILEMPGGQSGHPFSKHYRDQQPYWQAGEMVAFQPGEISGTLYFLPD